MNNNNFSRYTGTTKGSLMVMRTSIMVMCFLGAGVIASTDTEENRLDKIQMEMNSILNKAGIDFSGTFRSQYFGSGLDDASGENAVNWGNSQTETNEFTSVDFDIKARPNEALTARLIFRMHQNWQNFFSDVANPIFTRWISIDGNAGNMFRFNVGHYRQRYSKLTLWSPDITIAYEPEIFAEKRRAAQKEEFLGDNNRILQGINFNMDAEIVPIFNEFHLNLTGARLRCGGANYKNGSAITDNIEDAPMDRYFTGINLDLIALKGLGIGGSVLRIFDYAPTFNGPIYTADSLARSGLITAFRLQPSTSMFLESQVFAFGLDFEVAMSNNRDSAWADPAKLAVNDTVMLFSNNSGTAINVDVKGNVQLGASGKIEFTVGYMSNDSAYLNELAQSPTFLGQRIMNIENDQNSGMLYSTFDALYNSVFKFAPNSSIMWSKSPRRKISYLTAILTPAEIDSMATKGKSFFQKADSAIQLVLPYGPATPNRVGPKGEVHLTLFEGGIDAGLEFAMLNEAMATVPNEKAKFSRMGGGLCIDIATWVKALNSCQVNGGVTMENAEQGALKSENSFLNAGVYYNFWKRFSFLGGYQQIVNNTTATTGTVKVIQSQWAVGLEYKVSETGKLIGRFGKVAEKNEELLKANDYSAGQTELFLTVDF